MKNKVYTHYWICGLTGFLAGLLAFFICTHNFEFFWPFNWPIRITKAERIVSMTKDTVLPQDPTYSNFLKMECNDGLIIESGTKVKVRHNDKIMIGKIYQFKPNNLWPIIVMFEDTFEPAYMGNINIGNNWENYRCAEIIQFLGD